MTNTPGNGNTPLFINWGWPPKFSTLGHWVADKTQRSNLSKSDGPHVMGQTTLVPMAVMTSIEARGLIPEPCNQRKASGQSEMRLPRPAACLSTLGPWESQTAAIEPLLWERGSALDDSLFPLWLLHSCLCGEKGFAIPSCFGRFL